jgi:hypothetical protein
MEKAYNLEPDFIFQPNVYATWNGKYWITNIDEMEFTEISEDMYNFAKKLDNVVLQTPLEVLVGDRLPENMKHIELFATQTNQKVLNRALSSCIIDPELTADISKDHLVTAINFTFKNNYTCRIIIGQQEININM